MRYFTMVFAALAVFLVASSAQAQFSYHPQKDAMTDVDRGLILALGEDSDLSISVRCMSDGLNVVVTTGYMGGDRNDQVRVQMRFGNEPAPAAALWSQSTNSRAAFAPMKDVAGLIAKFRAHDTLVLRVVDPLDDETKTTRVSLADFEQAYAQLGCRK
jgi:hypothetical protein